MSVRSLDHTADVAFVVRAPSWEDLYREAAWALSNTIAEAESLGEEMSVDVEVEAEDREALMVEWLQELLYRFDVEGFLGKSFEVSLRERGESGRILRARAKGQILDLERHVVKTAVKGVTWHGLVVGPSGDGFEARVVLDV